jgi:SAM-dependent methyltransferase
MDIRTDTQKGLRIDLGCGAAKKEGTLGIDAYPGPGVDYVHDIENQPLPFVDRSVEYVFSSHFLEHITELGRVFGEIGRVCMDQAILELWTPYAWHNNAWLFGHKTYFTEELYMHPCVYFPDFWAPQLGSRWILNELQYVIDGGVLASLQSRGIDVSFALKHMHNIASEFCARITVLHSPPPDMHPPVRRTYSVSRTAERHPLSY